MYFDDKTPVAFEGVDDAVQDVFTPLALMAEQVRLYGGTISPVLNT